MPPKYPMGHVLDEGLKNPYILYNLGSCPTTSSRQILSVQLSPFFQFTIGVDATRVSSSPLPG